MNHDAAFKLKQTIFFIKLFQKMITLFVSDKKNVQTINEAKVC